jgi:hypothetical protein
MKICCFEKRQKEWKKYTQEQAKWDTALEDWLDIYE